MDRRIAELMQEAALDPGAFDVDAAWESMDKLAYAIDKADTMATSLTKNQPTDRKRGRPVEAENTDHLRVSFVAQVYMAHTGREPSGPMLRTKHGELEHSHFSRILALFITETTGRKLGPDAIYKLMQRAAAKGYLGREALCRRYGRLSRPRG